ncbi:CAP domain-containing protein [Cellulosilyticum ruminicola]|uniref:CAP domain-containing protein n=1 Tax=Cellulosilyticum ruminicola TaxID=425254 RepID=UPI0006CFE831|nr:CAP domain-containing protein [Cellulosilyticum ruminicola]
MKRAEIYLLIGAISIFGGNAQAAINIITTQYSAASTTQNPQSEKTIGYKGKTINLGSNLETLQQALGKPDLKLSDGTYDIVFYTKDANETIIFYMQEDAVVGFCTNAKSFKFREITYGKIGEVTDSDIIAIKDELQNNKIVAIAYNVEAESDTTSTAYLKANERVIIALTNGFRAKSNVTPLKYNEKLTGISRSHSEEMANKNYFSHTDAQGLSPSRRMTNGGINWKSCAENIAAGNGLGIETFGQWLNSEGHRKNMLQQTGDIGVGAAYSSSSTYKYYYTQNFAKLR